MTQRRSRVVSLLATAVALLTASPALAAWQSNFSGFGATLQGDLYTPSTVAASPAVLVAIHYCSGNAGNAHGWFDSYADKNGFYIIAPNAGKNCFDSSASRDGDKAAIVKMVDYLITNKNADKSRVFAAGFSSGGCMTNTLIAIYPDVFAGGSAMPGFPAGGWPAGDTSCTKCGSTPPNNTAQQWGDIARKAFPWSGTYPCSQQWVGGADEYNFNGWLPAVASQFQNLSNLGSGTSDSSAPSGWTRTVYKNTSGNVWLETNVKAGQKHDLTGSGLFGYVITFLGLDKPTGACGITGPSTGTGGAGAGGATGAGGAIGTGGTGGAKDGGPDAAKDAGSGGGPGTGGITSVGTTGSGGNGTGSGGATASGGVVGSGGTSSAGGGTAGGVSGSGGKSGTGGTVGSGGSTTASSGSGSGGSLASVGSGSGGSTGSGGGSGSGGSSTSTGGTAAGCTCALGGRTSPPGLILLVLGAALALRRRIRR